MRAAALSILLAGCLPVYEEEAPACPATTVVVHRDGEFACEPRPAACAQPQTCGNGACGLAVLALCGDSTSAVVLCGEDEITTEVVCDAQ
jgi:hypothetical protein